MPKFLSGGMLIDILRLEMKFLHNLVTVSKIFILNSATQNPHES